VNGAPSATPATPVIGHGTEDRHRIGLAFGSALRQLRRARGLTQEGLALVGGFDRTYPSLLERGLRTPTLSVLFRLAEALGVEPGRLLTLTEDHLSGDREIRSGAEPGG
jgi:transcriptional regulator with XRE-family HTH domain